jgi:exopolysaccharide biosynthesis polyprenyl glycosylphosphotransferase
MALYIALFLSRKGLFIFPQRWNYEYQEFLVLAVAAWIVITAYMRLYRSHRAERLEFAADRLLRTLVLWALFTTAGVFLWKLSHVSRQFILYVFFLSGILILGRQALTMAMLRRLRRFGYDSRTAVIIGERQDCERFADTLTKTVFNGYQVMLAPTDSGDNEALLDTPAESFSEVQEAFILPTAANRETHALRFLKDGKSVHIVPGLVDARLFRQELSDVGGIPVLSLLNGSLSAVQAGIKRSADVLGAVVLLMVSAPLFAVVVIVNKLESRAPVFFTQERMGREGKPFLVFKFRTMVADAEQVLKRTPELYQKYLENNYKLPEGEDPRITRIGRFLRATSLDELPQLFNVLRGDMSLVGPRPVVPQEVENYADYASLFLSAKPGMTGHWQVSGRSEIKEYARRVELDLEYIRDQSLSKDLEILLRTIPAVLLRRGAH